MKQILICFLFLVLFECCEQQNKFDKKKWAEVADLMTFPHRNAMVKDLIENFKLKGKTYSEIIELLNQPSGISNHPLEIFYIIELDYGYNIDPMHCKSLVFKFDKDSIVQEFQVSESEQ